MHYVKHYVKLYVKHYVKYSYVKRYCWVNWSAPTEVVSSLNSEEKWVYYECMASVVYRGPGGGTRYNTT